MLPMFRQFEDTAITFFSPKPGISEQTKITYFRMIAWLIWVVCNLFVVIDVVLMSGFEPEIFKVQYIYFMPGISLGVIMTYLLPLKHIHYSLVATAATILVALVPASSMGGNDFSGVFIPAAALGLIPMAGVFPISPKHITVIMVCFAVGLVTVSTYFFHASPTFQGTMLYLSIAIGGYFGITVVFHMLLLNISNAAKVQLTQIDELTKMNMLLNISLNQNQFGLVGYNKKGHLVFERGASVMRVFGRNNDFDDYSLLSGFKKNLKNSYDIKIELLLENVQEVRSNDSAFLLQAYQLDDMIIISHMDISKISKIEEKLQTQQQLALIGEITSGVAHNYNNALAIALSNLETVPDGYKKEHYRDHIQPSIKAIERSAELSRKLLALAGRQHLKWEIFDVSEALNNMMELIKSAVGAKIHIEIIAQGEFFIRTDKQEFESAILNLAINSKIALEKPNGFLTIQVIREEDTVKIMIEDDGPGIPQSIQDKVFDPFFTTRDISTSTGLGLSTVKGFVEQSEGHVRLTSRPGSTVFTLYFPIMNKDNVTPIMTRSKNLHDKIIKTNDNISLLIVDDNILVGQTMTKLVNSLGYNANFKSSIQAAIECVKYDEKITHVFLDLSMPEMDGIELGEILFKLKPNIKIYLITGEATVERMNEAISKGFSDVFIKPVSSKKIQEALYKNDKYEDQMQLE